MDDITSRNTWTRRVILTKEVMARIPDMVQSGMDASDIAEHLGCSKATLKVRCCQAGISLRVPGYRRSRSGRIIFPGELMQELTEKAQEYGMSENELARIILKIVIKDDLFDAVLDPKKPRVSGL
jgi:hypothetical protein